MKQINAITEAANHSGSGTSGTMNIYGGTASCGASGTAGEHSPGRKGGAATLPFPWTAADIPLYLVPETIARMIRARGAAVYRISVMRTHHHHYNVSMRTRRIRKELVGRAVRIECEPAQRTNDRESPRAGEEHAERREARGQVREEKEPVNRKNIRKHMGTGNERTEWKNVRKRVGTGSDRTERKNIRERMGTGNDRTEQKNVRERMGTGNERTERKNVRDQVRGGEHGRHVAVQR